MHIPWSVVNHSGWAARGVEDRIYRKIAKLENLLRHFSSDAVHLHIVLDRSHHRREFSASLTLRLPSNLLHVEKRGDNLTGALDEAVRTLERQLTRAKSSYRHDSDWRAKSRRSKLHAARAGFRPLPVPADKAPRHAPDLVADLLTEQYDRLLTFIGRKIEDQRLSGVIEAKAIDPRDVADRVAQIALRHPGLKPVQMTAERWFLSLAYHEVRRAVRRWLAEKGREIPLDLDVSPAGSFALAEEHGPGDTIEDAVWEAMEPPEVTEQDYIGTPDTERPDIRAEEHSLLDFVRELSRDWEPAERDVFDMYFVEGFDPVEIAMVFKWKPEDVERIIRRIRIRMRNRMRAVAAAAPGSRPTARDRLSFARRVRKMAGQTGE